MKAPGNQFWPLALVVVFFVVPLGFISTQRIYIGSETARAVVIAALIVALLLGTVAAAFFVLAVLRIALRDRRRVDLTKEGREQAYISLAAGFLAATVGVTLALYSPPFALAYGVLVALYLVFTAPASRRRLAYRSVITVRCSPQAAFAFVSNPTNWRRIHPELEVIEPFDSPLRVGSIVRQRVTVGRYVLEGEDEVTVIEPDQKLGTRVRGRRRPSSDLYELEPVEGGTEITYSYQSEMTVPVAVNGGVLNRGPAQRFLQSRRDLAMERIKHVLESEPSTPV